MIAFGLYDIQRMLNHSCRYVDFLLEALKRQDLFAWIQLVPETWWHSLLWRDAFNFLGVHATLPPALHEQLTNRPGTLSQVGFP